MNPRTTLSALTVSALLLLTACTSGAVEPPGLTGSPSPTATSSPTPEPTPTDGIQVHDDPELGIVFEDVPDLTGDEAEVYNWVATYQKAFWQTLRTNEVADTFATFTSAEIQETMAGIAAGNTADGVTIAGTFHTRISNVVVTGDTASAVRCSDFRDATFSNAEGTFNAVEAQWDVPQRSTLELLRLDTGIWYVNKIVDPGSC